MVDDEADWLMNQMETLMDMKADYDDGWWWWG